MQSNFLKISLLALAVSLATTTWAQNDQPKCFGDPGNIVFSANVNF